MKKKLFLVVAIKKVAAVFLVLITFTVKAQQISGETNLPNNTCCFSGFSWTIDYKIVYNRNNARTLDLEFSSKSISVARYKWKTEGKQFSPSDLGLTSWPVSVIKDQILNGDVTVFYKSKPVKTYNQMQLEGIRLGTFNKFDLGGDPKTASTNIGGTKIYLSDFNLSDFTVRITNVTSGGANPPGTEELYKIYRKLKAGVEKSNHTNANVSLHAPNPGNSSNTSNVRAQTNGSTGGAVTPANSTINTLDRTPQTQQSGSARLSDKVKVNGDYVQVFQQGNKYYMVNSDGSQHETTKIAYDKINSAAVSSSAKNNPVATENASRASDQARESVRYAEEQANAAKIARTELTVQTVTQAANLAGELLGEWQANRERRWAEERAREETRKSTVIANKIAYEKLVSTTSDYLLRNKNSYLKMLENDLPQVLRSDPISWEQIIGTKEYNKTFGKPKMKKKSATDFEAIQLPDVFSSQYVKEEKIGREFFYWVKADFYEHRVSFLYNQDNICAGLRMYLATDRAEESVHIKDYYDELKTNLKSGYIMLDGNSFATYDKLFVLEFNRLTIFDLNFLDPTTNFILPSKFTDSGNIEDPSIVNPLGVVVKGKAYSGTSGVEITTIVANSLADKYGLKRGDVIQKLNDVSIKFPYHLKWFFYAFPNDTVVKLTVRRQDKPEIITINLYEAK